MHRGHEEIGSGALPSYLQTDPELFRADAIVIGDTGSSIAGTPTATTTLRGMCTVIIEVRTLRSSRHSGTYGGAAPDALLALLRAIATLHDERGDVAVAGLARNEWHGPSQARSNFETQVESWPACH